MKLGYTVTAGKRWTVRLSEEHDIVPATPPPGRARAWQKMDYHPTTRCPPVGFASRSRRPTAIRTRTVCGPRRNLAYWTSRSRASSVTSRRAMTSSGGPNSSGSASRPTAGRSRSGVVPRRGPSGMPRCGGRIPRLWMRCAALPSQRRFTRGAMPATYVRSAPPLPRPRTRPGSRARTKSRREPRFLVRRRARTSRQRRPDRRRGGHRPHRLRHRTRTGRSAPLPQRAEPRAARAGLFCQPARRSADPAMAARLGQVPQVWREVTAWAVPSIRR